MKYRIKSTGEIVTVIRYGYTGDFTVYADAQGREHNEKLNFFTDFEEVEESKEIDWEQRRYELTKEVIRSLDIPTSEESGNVADYISGIVYRLINTLKHFEEEE